MSCSRSSALAPGWMVIIRLSAIRRSRSGAGMVSSAAAAMLSNSSGDTWYGTCRAWQRHAFALQSRAHASTRAAVALLLAADARARRPRAAPRPRRRPPATPTPAPTPPPPTPTPVPPLASPAIIQVENSPGGRPQSGPGRRRPRVRVRRRGRRRPVQRLLLHPAAGHAGGRPGAQRAHGDHPAGHAVPRVRRVLGSVARTSAACSSRASFPSFDEDSARGNLFRISARAPPHNLYTDGQHIAKLAATAARGAVGYQLWARTSRRRRRTPGHRLHRARVGVERPRFTWVPTLNGFTRTEDTGIDARPRHRRASGPAHGRSCSRWRSPPTRASSTSTVTSASTRPSPGTGTAQVFTGGQEYQATWTQPASGPPQFTLADGTPAPIAPGEVWISLVPIGQPAVLG